MEAVTAVGEAFFSTLFEALLNKFKASDLNFGTKKKKVFIEWETRLRSIKAVLTDAEDKQDTNSGVKIWLDELKDLGDDVEFVLDEFAYYAFQRRSSTAQPRTSTGNKVKRFFSTTLRGILLDVKMGSKIKDISARLQLIATQKSNLELDGKNVGGKAYKLTRGHIQPTSSLVIEVNVFGRDLDKEAILESLLVEQTSDDTQVPVINITGMAGIGKTTLAQLIYNDDKVEGFFDLRAWIHVSEDFDVKKVTKTILQAVIDDTDPTRGILDINELDLQQLHLKLKEKLSGKKLLLVFDDVWNQNYADWSLLIRPFEVGILGNSGCKIIITTRNQNVAQITGTGTVSAYSLKELASDDCLSVLACHALGSKNFDRHPHLKEIGKQIVKKCKGLPSAVIFFASLLRSKPDYKEWDAVSRRKMRDLIPDFADLRLSYHHLPSHLKLCFAYSSLIPKGFEFDRDELILWWIAEGFVLPKGNMQLEYLGRQYFSELLSRSFFQQSNNNKSLFVMHDLIIDLAQSVTGNKCFNMEHDPEIDDGQGQHYYEKARHVSFIRQQYDVSQRFEIISKMKCVRSFLALSGSYQSKYCYLSSKVLQELLPKLKRLRVLSLSGYFIEELPNSIGDLKHLRCLNLSKTAIGFLPESVGALFHLKELILKQCEELVALPVGIGRLTKLRCLDITETPKLKDMPSGLGNLTSLQVLPKFIIGKAGQLTLRDLKDLSHLQGHLSIFNLHNLVDVQDASVANLKQKKGIKGLALEWSDDCKNKHKQMRVLESLQPPEDIQRLSISCYGAENFPYWVRNPFFAKIEQLEQLDLSDCMNCPSLPSLGQLPLLRNLNIRGMYAVKTLGPEFYGEGYPCVKVFPSLEFLRFENMPECKEWNLPDGNVEVFPCLRELILHNCPKLSRKLPRNLCSLVKLDVQKCPELLNSPLSFSGLGELTLEDSSCIILRSTVDQSSIIKLKIKRISDLTCLSEELTKALVKLEVLEIEDCSDLACLWQNGSQLEKLSCLKSLVIKKCPELVSLVRENQGLFRLSSLEDLRIESCQKFVSFPPTGLPYKLKCLVTLDCKALESLPDTFGMTDSNTHHCILEELEIVGCPSVKSFPNGKLPSTLKRLTIENCRNMQFLPDRDARRDGNENGLEYMSLANCLASEFFLENALSFPNLKVIRISNCRNLRALPYQMQSLTSLRELSLSDCEDLTSIPEGGLPHNIISLELRNCEKLNQPISEWGLEKVIHLSELKIVGSCPAADMVSFPDDESMMLPRTLTKLCIESLKNLESLSRGLENLIALRQLHIKNCPKLRSLPKTGLPDSLGRLCISGCPVLQEKCRKGKREYWPIISHIPCLEIN